MYLETPLLYYFHGIKSFEKLLWGATRVVLIDFEKIHELNRFGRVLRISAGFVRIGAVSVLTGSVTTHGLSSFPKISRISPRFVLIETDWKDSFGLDWEQTHELKRIKMVIEILALSRKQFLDWHGILRNQILFQACIDVFFSNSWMNYVANYK